MNDNTLDTLLENWEHEITGVPKHWEKSDKRKAIDKKYRAQLTQMVKEIIGDYEMPPEQRATRYIGIPSHQRDALREQQFARARKYGLEIE